MKAKKIFAAVAIALLAVIAGVLVCVMYLNPSVDDVEHLQMSANSDSSISIKWNKTGAKGYIVYESTDNSVNQIAKIDDSSVNEYTIKDLEQASIYKYCVTAYKVRGDRIFESENRAQVDAYTIPSAQSIEKLESDTAGIMQIDWSLNNRATGYQLQYVKGKGDDFSSATTVDFDDYTVVSHTVKKLDQKKKYSARVRSFMIVDKARVYGEWSKVKSVAIEEELVLPNGINPNKPMVALTFDDGPGYNSASDDILDVLEKYNARATFFMIGENAAAHPDNVKRKQKLGMELGNHTYNHQHYGKNIVPEDIKKASDAMYKACGEYPTAFRSPGGNTTQLILDECKKENMTAYHWSLDTMDWKYRDADHVYNAVMKNVEDGDIILMHEIYPSTAKAVKKLVPELIKKGYQIVTCSELVQAKTGKKPKIGNQYSNATSIRNNTR